MKQKASSPKLALITGATSGLGKGLSQFLQAKGTEVIEMGSKSCDLRDKAERKKLLDLITERKPDLIVNNAGFGLYGPTLSHSIEEELDMIEVNVSALVEISLHAARTLIDAGKRGTILNISSAAAFLPYPTFNTYAASKAFVVRFSLALDAELRGQGVRVLCACPGQIATNFRSRAAKGHPQKGDRRTMSIEEAVQHLWKQIEGEKPLYVFDWRSRSMLFFGRLMPAGVRNRLLTNRLKERYSS